MKYIYEIKIFNSEEMYFESEDKYLTIMDDVIVDIKIFNNKEAKENLILYWNTLFKQYEGMNYCIIDSLNNKVFLSGSYDPNDIDIIEDYINKQ